MSTLAEVLAEVQLIVPRPNQDALIRAKINQMVSYISKTGLYWRDIVEATLTSTDGIDPTALIQSITITNAVRRLIYVKNSNEVVECLDIESVLKGCASKEAMAYLSGTTLHISHLEAATTFDWAYYTSPADFATDGSDDANTNWILDTVPGLVVDMTAAYILNLIGANADSKQISQLAAMLKGTYIQDMVLSVI